MESAETTADTDGAGSVALADATGPDLPTVAANDVSLASASPFGTALAITASVDVAVPDVRVAVNDLPDLVAANGGAIFDSQIAVGDPKSASATVTVKIPPAGLEHLISGLGGLGELTGRSQQTEDVADQLADTRNRIDAAQASVDRVRALLASAVDIDAVIRIEGELTIRETALEQLLATERNVSDRVQLATLTIVFTPKQVEAVVVPPPAVMTGAKVTPANSVARAFTSGWRGFVTAVHTVVVGLAYVVPLLAIVLLAAIGAWALRRLRRPTKHPAPAVTSTD
jgi:hypothetical protein